MNYEGDNIRKSPLFALDTEKKYLTVIPRLSILCMIMDFPARPASTFFNIMTGKTK
jgi:hypothetical protein